MHKPPGEQPGSATAGGSPGEQVAPITRENPATPPPE
jgi:hypothetical protein